MISRLVSAKQSSRTSREFDFYALEDRVLLNGDSLEDTGPAEVSPDGDWLIADSIQNTPVFDPLLAANSDPVSVDQDANVAASDEPTAQESGIVVSHEIAFVDAELSDYQQLVDDLFASRGESRHIDVILLDSSRDGIRQIGEVLAQHNDLDAVHFVSHGISGAIKLGGTWLSSEVLEANAVGIAGWGTALADNGDLLFYGCDFASDQDGQLLIDNISELTGADVAASTDDTGAATLGGNWSLEYATGTIESNVAFSSEMQGNWQHLMSNETVLDNFSVSSYSNNNGTQSWSSAWIESDAGGGGSASGWFNVSGGVLQAQTHNTGNNIYREVDLSSALSATLSFSYNNGTQGNSAIIVQASSNGGGSYTTLSGMTFNSATNTGSGSVSADISAYMSSNTRIRLYVTGSETGGGKYSFSVDNVQIAYVTNSAPLLNAAQSPALNAVGEDGGPPVGAVGTLVSSLVDFSSPLGQIDNVSDADAGASLGIAVTGADSSTGSWYFTTDNGSSWTALGAVSDTTSRLLAADANTRLYFEPNADYNGTMSDAITFRAWDQTSGTSGGVADTSGRTGTMLDSFSVNAYSNNNGSLNWSSDWVENDTAGGGATGGKYYVANSSLYFTQSTVGGWISRQVDLNQATSASFSGALVANSLTAGASIALQISGDGGASFATLATITSASPLGSATYDVTAYASSNTQIRLYDNTGGTNYIRLDDFRFTTTGRSGGTTAFSNDTDTASLVVNPINDAPVLDNTGTPTLNSITEDQLNNSGQTVAAIVASAGGDRITDVDSGASEGIAISSLTSGNGTWQFSTDAGGTWSDIGTVSNTSALLLRSTDLVRFVPDGSNGTSADFSFRAWDQTSGTAGTKVSLASNGGETAFSTAIESATIVVTDVNDAPLITSNGGGATASISIAENQTAVTTVTSSDVDLPAQTISYSITGGADAAKFAINSTTGAVSFVSGRDRENPTDADGDGVYEVDVQASDGSLTDVQSLQVTITDVNEFAVSSPSDGDVGANSADENAANGTAVGLTASATDADATNNTVTFAMVDDAGGRFAVDATTGVVTVANGSLLDRESAASHTVTIRATSSDGSTADSSFTININDVDEFDVGAVTDSDAAANAVNENAANGTVVGVTALATDADATDAITYTLDDDAGGRFAIDATTGVVTVADGTLLDRETASSHNITIRATSSDASFSTQAMTINVNDVDEFDVGAVTDSDAAANAVNENAANGTAVGVTALASDADATTNGITYTLDNDAGGRFAIDATTGVVTVADGTLLDRESASSHNITIRATSSDASFSTQAMTINVNDVDEFDVGAVSDTDAAANAVNENAANGTVVGVTALASDADATTNGITYTLDNNAGGRFAIDATTGVVTVADGTLLDRESASSHNITIRATSSDASFNTQAMTITVNDVDEFDVGAVSDTDAAANAVNENAANGTVVGVTALASDADATTNGITYTLDNDAGGRFAIDATTGVVTVADGTLLDRESASSHNITIRATSGDASFSTQAMTINVNDVDEFNVGAVTDSDATANAVNENAGNGTAVGVTALASDADATTNGITYTLDNDAGGRFAINATTGVVTVADGTLLDRETASSHNITIRATSSDASFSTQAMTINVNDVDEFDVGAVTDSDATANAVNENAVNGTVVGVTALASDADATTNGITYTLDNDAGGRFAINATTGVVTVADGTLLDRESASSYNITIRATSGDASFSTQAMTINVNDVDEFNVGAVTDSDATANAVNENAANGTAVGVTALASDADATTNSITYTLDDDAGGRFAINATTGVVTVADGTLLDRESASSHNITIRATSGDASFSAQTMTINVNDVDEFNVGAVTDSDAAANAVNENAANGTAVGVTALASDADATTNGITYTLDNDAGGRFAINATTGVVTVADGTLLDRETASSHNITIRATSSDASFSTQAMTINVNDVDEFDVGAVTDSDATANAVDENAANGTVVGMTALASDADATTNSITYTLDDDAGGRFAIDATTGVVTVADGTLLDRESASSHNITIRATSSDASFSTQAMTINVNDVDEFDVGAVSDTDATANAVDENAANGTAVGVTALASDADAATNGITYTLDDDAGGRFAINATTGVVTVADGTLIDRESASSHNITIRATSGDASFSTQAMTINVSDVDEFDVGAVTDSDAAANAVNENAVNGTVVGVTALASDADATTNGITYTLDDDAGGRFAINATTGVVAVADGTLLDRESASSHNITIRATSSDASFSTQAMTINVNDVDEFDVGAVTDSDAAANAVNENAANGTAVGVTALASDADATTNGITYTLDDNAGGRFAIDATTGVVTVADGTLLDRESASNHNITIRATSGDASFSTQAMTINVNDVDEFDVGAVTDSDATVNAVNENAANGTAVGVTALASDADATTNGITYTLDDNAGGRFAIDATTGVVTVADGTLLDRESASNHNITIRATSGDASFSTQAMTINVNDVDEFDVGAVSDTDAAANAVNENAANGTVVGVTALASDADATTNGITYTLADNDGGRFAIDATTGVVTVAGAINRETDGPVRNINIQATSADGSVVYRNIVIQVNDLDESDVGAVNDGDAAANQVDENATIGTSVGVTATASDADATASVITYSLIDDDGGRFAIDSTTGVVTVAGAIDREADGPVRTVTVRATSADGSASDQAFAVSINDLDEFDVGVVTDTDAAANAVNENAVNGTIVGVTALASDADATTNSITYALDDDAGGRFAINATTGVVTVADGTLLDREAASSHNITIRATSGDASFSTHAMTIIVNDVDEFDVGAVSDTDAAANAVNENAANGTVVGVAALASDADATTNGITYTLADNDGGRFAIDATTGVVTVAGPIDRELDGPVRNINIQATSDDGSIVYRNIVIQVNDLDESDVGAVNDADAAANQVDENATIGTSVGVTATASDADATASVITYSLIDDDGGRFAIDSMTGVVTVAGAIDREADGPVRTVTVRATSADGSTSDQAFAVSINDLDEFDVGVVTDSDVAANAVNENAANGTIVGVTALASDADATTNGITYTLDDDAGSRFAIDATTGVVTVADGTLLDREAASSHNITIRATSSDASFRTQAMTITVNDVDEFDVGAVSDTDAAANAVNENAANGTVVGVTALASDADATTSGITYTLADNDGGRFAIDATTGVVTVAGAINRETDGPVRNINIQATSADGSVVYRNIVIQVNDLDESDVGAVNDGDAAANQVDENATIGTSVGVTATASDADATASVITYSLIDDDGGRFAIDSTTGVVTVAGAIDREADGPVRTVTVRATSADGSTSDQAFAVSINDLDEFDVGVVTDVDAAANAVDENAANGTIVGVTALASDADATTNSITYALDDDAGGRFAINATTGVVTVADGTLLDREAASSHNITIRATSSDASFSTQAMTINVNDVDESDVGAVTDSDITANAVDENAANGTIVGVTALASDADATTNGITYSLVDDDGGRFAIDSMTGVVSVAGAIDREADGPVRTVTVRATSADGSTSEQNFAISINDLDEFDVGVVSDSDAAINGVDENAAVGTVVGVAASASDADATTSGISYSLADDDGGRFAINATTGVVTVAGALDYESDGSSRSITILASSADGSSRSTTVSIDLYDVNDNAPVIVNNNLTISEGQRVTLGLSELDATDADSTNLSFVVLNAVGGHFERDGFPGQPVTLFTRAEIASGSIDFVHDGSETVPGYSLTVSDSQFTSGAVQASIAWTPVNDATTIAGSPAQITYVENAAPLWIAPAALLADSDSAQLSTLTVEIVGYRPSEDSLVLTGTTSLVALWEVSSGKFTLSGSGSVAQYQSALRELAYVNSSENPSAGARWVQVVVDDGQTDSLVTSIALNVLPVNDAPLASGESYSMLTGGALQIAEPGLLANDVDLEGDALTTLLVLPPARGRVTITANGGMVYTPNAGFFGQDVIRYQVSDGSASSSIVEIQIQVEAVNSGNSSQPPAGPAPTQTTGVPEPAASEDGEAKDRDAARADAPSGEQSDAPGGGPVAGRGQSGGSAAGVSSAGQPLEVVSGSTGIFDPDAILAESGDRNTMYSRSIARSGLEREGGHERSPSLLRGTSQESDRDPSDLVILDGGISADIEQSIVWSNWDQVQEDAAEEYESDSYMIGVVGTSASVLSVGYTLWVIRGSVLAATMMGSVPGWGMVDPASLLQIYRDRSKEREDDVEKMLY